MPDIADRLSGANLPPAPPNISNGDRQFLTDLWTELRLRPRTADVNAEVLTLVDTRFRASDVKNAHATPQVYLATLQNLVRGPGAQWNLSMQSQSAVGTWVAGACTSGHDYLVCKPWTGAVVWRVYVNTTADHAPAVFGALCTGIVNGNIPAFGKLGSFDIVRTGRDAVVAYAGSVAARDTIVALLQAYVHNNPGHVVNEIVRFTVQRAPGVSVAGDPTAMMQAWMTAANAWLGEETYRSNIADWEAQHGRSVGPDEGPYHLSFSELVTTVIARAWRVTPADGNFLSAVAVAFGDIGLDLATGALAPPTEIGVAWLQDRFFPEF
ncbi:MAG: T3SS effector HopA1 family protein [Pseudonocardia sp.]